VAHAHNRCKGVTTVVDDLSHVGKVVSIVKSTAGLHYNQPTSELEFLYAEPAVTGPLIDTSR